MRHLLLVPFAALIVVTAGAANAATLVPPYNPDVCAKGGALVWSMANRGTVMVKDHNGVEQPTDFGPGHFECVYVGGPPLGHAPIWINWDGTRGCIAYTDAAGHAFLSFSNFNVWGEPSPESWTTGEVIQEIRIRGTESYLQTCVVSARGLNMTVLHLGNKTAPAQWNSIAGSAFDPW